MRIGLVGRATGKRFCRPVLSARGGGAPVRQACRRQSALAAELGQQHCQATADCGAGFKTCGLKFVDRISQIVPGSSQWPLRRLPLRPHVPEVRPPAPRAMRRCRAPNPSAYGRLRRPEADRALTMRSSMIVVCRRNSSRTSRSSRRSPSVMLLKVGLIDGGYLVVVPCRGHQTRRSHDVLPAEPAFSGPVRFFTRDDNNSTKGLRNREMRRVLSRRQ